MMKTAIINENIGLMYGSGGQILVNFLKSQYLYSGNAFHHAEKQLDLLSEKIIQGTDFSFDRGISGIGWMVGYLAKIGILNVNTDDILEDMDDELYKDTLVLLSNGRFDINSYLGRLNYYQSRHFVEGNHRDPYRHFIHFECLKLLVSKLSEYLNTLNTREVLNFQEMGEASLIITKFSYLMDMSIGEKLFETAFYSIMEKACEQLKCIEKEVDKGENHLVSLYLESTLMLYLSAWIYGNPHWSLPLEQIFSRFICNKSNSEIRCRCQLIKDIFMDATINLDQLTKLLTMKDGRYWLIFILTNRKDLKFIN